MRHLIGGDSINVENDKQPYAKVKLNIGEHGVPGHIERIAMPDQIKVRD